MRQKRMMRKQPIDMALLFPSWTPWTLLPLAFGQPPSMDCLFCLLLL